MRLLPVLTIAIPQTGAAVVICSAVVGQMLGSYAIDAFGLFGVEKVPFSWARLGGLGLGFRAAVFFPSRRPALA